MNRMRVVLVLPLGLALACESSAEVAAPSPTPEPEPTATADRCEPASPGQSQAILDGIREIGEENEIGPAVAVRSRDFEQVWFVAAMLRGPGIAEPGAGPGVWAMSGSKETPGLVLSVNTFAREFSPYPDGSATDAAITMEDDGAKDAEACAAAWAGS